MSELLVLAHEKPWVGSSYSTCAEIAPLPEAWMNILIVVSELSVRYCGNAMVDVKGTARFGCRMSIGYDLSNPGMRP
jgi:hypothetical protein